MDRVYGSNIGIQKACHIRRPACAPIQMCRRRRLTCVLKFRGRDVLTNQISREDASYNLVSLTVLLPITSYLNPRDYHVLLVFET